MLVSQALKPMFPIHLYQVRADVNIASKAMAWTFLWTLAQVRPRLRLLLQRSDCRPRCSARTDNARSEAFVVARNVATSLPAFFDVTAHNIMTSLRTISWRQCMQVVLMMDLTILYVLRCVRSPSWKPSKRKCSQKFLHDVWHDFLKHFKHYIKISIRSFDVILTKSAKFRFTVPVHQFIFFPPHEQISMIHEQLINEHVRSVFPIVSHCPPTTV